MVGQNCRAGCSTRNHRTWGECARAAAMRVGWSKSHLGIDASREKSKNRELDLYAEARAAGIQPATTRTPDIHKAFELSDKASSAFDATDNTFSNGAHYSPRTGQVVKFD